MTRSSDLVMVEREVLANAVSELKNLLAMCEGEVPSLLEDHFSYPKIVDAIEAGERALQSVEGGVRVAAKQESCPESAPRTETAIVTALRECHHDAGNLRGLAEPNHHQPHALRQGWRDDMENAPRDGTRILVTGGGLGGDVEVAEYNKRVGCWNAQTCTLDDRDDEADGYSAPTHWMPLPAPPAPENTPRDSSESTTGGTAPDHTTMEERGR